MFKAKRILVPIDFSPESELALEWAVMMAKEEPDASIELCHVTPFLAPAGPEPVAFDYARLEEEERKSVERKLKRYQGRIPQGISCGHRHLVGSIAQEVERLCNEKSIDLVVMTTRGRRGLSRFLHGSTTEETARLAPCPVLVLHLNETSKTAVKAA